MLRVLWIGADVHEPLPKWKKKILSFVNRTSARILLFFFGVYYIRSHFRNIQEFDPTYPKQTAEELNQKPTVLITNHIGLPEILWTIYRFNPCFIGKWSTQFSPLTGKIL